MNIHAKLAQYWTRNKILEFSISNSFLSFSWSFSLCSFGSHSALEMKLIERKGKKLVEKREKNKNCHIQKFKNGKNTNYAKHFKIKNIINLLVISPARFLDYTILLVKFHMFRSFG